MEIVIILLLLSLCEKNNELKETLQSALKFYKENRELIRALYPTKENIDTSLKTNTAQTENAEGSLKLIEQFLNRQ